MLGEDLAQQRGITNIALDELWPLAAERFQSIDDAHPAVAQVIEDNDVVTRLGECHAGVGADVAGTAGD